MQDAQTIRMTDHETVLTTAPAEVGRTSEVLVLTASMDNEVNTILARGLDLGDVLGACRRGAIALEDEGYEQINAYVMSNAWPRQCGDATPAEIAEALRPLFPNVMVLGATRYAQGAPITDAAGTFYGTIGSVYTGDDLNPDPDVDREAVDQAWRNADGDMQPIRDSDSEKRKLEGMRTFYREWLTLVENVHYGVVDVREAVTDPDNLRILARPLAAVLLRDITMSEIDGEVGSTVRRLWLEGARRLTGEARANLLACYATAQIIDGETWRARFSLNAAQEASPGHSLSGLLLAVMETPEAATAALASLLESVTEVRDQVMGDA